MNAKKKTTLKIQPACMSVSEALSPSLSVLTFTVVLGPNLPRGPKTQHKHQLGDSGSQHQRERKLGITYFPFQSYLEHLRPMKRLTLITSHRVVPS